MKKYALWSAIAGVLAVVIPAPANAKPTNPEQAVGNPLMGLADFNGDGKADVWHVDGSIQWRVSYGAVSVWDSLAVDQVDPSRTWLADMNGDGKSDVFQVRSDGQWRVSKSGTGNWEHLAYANIDPTRTWVADLNGDGHDDVFNIRDDGQWQVSYSGTSNWAHLGFDNIDPARTWLADMNGDGAADVFNIRSDGQWRVSYGGSTNWFPLAFDFVDPSRIWVADLNGDGRADVFQAREDGQWRVSYSGESNWAHLAWAPVDPNNTWLADIDGDGKADVFQVRADGHWVVSYGGVTNWALLSPTGPIPGDTGVDPGGALFVTNGKTYRAGDFLGEKALTSLNTRFGRIEDQAYGRVQPPPISSPDGIALPDVSTDFDPRDFPESDARVPYIYDVMGSWTTKDNKTAVMRFGKWDPATRRGWGYRKILDYHHLGMKEVKATTQYPRPSGGVIPGLASSVVYYTDVLHVRCRGFLIFKSCSIVETLTIKAVVDYRKLSDLRSMGVITAYCLGRVECPSWVSESLNV